MAFFRSSKDTVFAGICGGMAEHLGWSVTGLRIVFVLFTLCGFPVLLPLYIAVWLISPRAAIKRPWD